jgi:excisionase family DNA binding protein
MPSSDNDILTIAELSQHLRVHPTTIYRLLRHGQIPGFRVGTAWRFSRIVIERWEKSSDSAQGIDSQHARERERGN